MNDDKSRLVVPCPLCGRVMWAGSPACGPCRGGPVGVRVAAPAHAGGGFKKGVKDAGNR